MTAPLDPQYVRLPRVLSITGISKPTVGRLIAKGLFPAPVKLGARLNLWRVDQIQKWAADPAGYRATQE